MKNLKQPVLLHQQLLTSSPPHTQMSETLQTMFKTKYESYLNRRSYMSAHVLLNLFKELRKRDKKRGLPIILSLFRDEFN